MSDCECSCDYDVNEPDVYRESLVKARKTHRCCECRREILPGETYEYVFGVWDFEPSIYKTCSDCLSIRMAFCRCGHSFTKLCATVRQVVFDCGGEVMSDKVVALTPRARDIVLGWIDKAFQSANDRDTVRKIMGGGE